MKAFVFQQPRLLNWRTVTDDVALPVPHVHTDQPIGLALGRRGPSRVFNATLRGKTPERGEQR
jgi:hypothetical protein